MNKIKIPWKIRWSNFKFNWKYGHPVKRFFNWRARLKDYEAWWKYGWPGRLIRKYKCWRYDHELKTEFIRDMRPPDWEEQTIGSIVYCERCGHRPDWGEFMPAPTGVKL